MGRFKFEKSIFESSPASLLEDLRVGDVKIVAERRNRPGKDEVKFSLDIGDKKYYNLYLPFLPDETSIRKGQICQDFSTTTLGSENPSVRDMTALRMDAIMRLAAKAACEAFDKDPAAYHVKWLYDQPKVNPVTNEETLNRTLWTQKPFLDKENPWTAEKWQELPGVPTFQLKFAMIMDADDPKNLSHESFVSIQVECGTQKFMKEEERIAYEKEHPRPPRAPKMPKKTKLSKEAEALLGSTPEEVAAEKRNKEAIKKSKAAREAKIAEARETVAEEVTAVEEPQV